MRTDDDRTVVGLRRSFAGDGLIWISGLGNSGGDGWTTWFYRANPIFLERQRGFDAAVADLGRAVVHIDLQHFDAILAELFLDIVIRERTRLLGI